jgi:uncharacterized protein YutE (UPF0331/DUF86 family)
MTPGRISRRGGSARFDALLRDIRALPLHDRQHFLADRRNVWAAESCLWRILETFFDFGRHMLAKGYDLGTSEDKKIAARLHEQGVLDQQAADRMRLLAGYRNRLVQFYHEVSPDELYDICAQQLGDLERVQNALRRWLREHPEKLDQTL